MAAEHNLHGAQVAQTHLVKATDGECRDLLVFDDGGWMDGRVQERTKRKCAGGSVAAEPNIYNAKQRDHARYVPLCVSFYSDASDPITNAQVSRVAFCGR